MTTIYCNDEEQPLLVTESASYETADDQDEVEATTKSTVPTRKRKITPAHAWLLVVAILYGSLNVTFRAIYALPNPPSASAMSTIRGWLAVVCFAPFLVARTTTTTTTSNTTPHSSSSTSDPKLYRIGVELAFWNFGAQSLVNVGLLYIPSARAAFFTQLSVVLTPCLSALSGQRIQSNVWWACGFALAGLVCMSQKGQEDGDSSAHAAFLAFGFGDLLCLLGALSWSTYLFRLSAVGGHYDEVELQALKTFLLAVFYSIWCGVEYWVSGGMSPWMGWTSLAAWALLFYSALGPGTVADVIQQKGQATVCATVANIILSMEPIFTAIFGRFMLGELMSGMEKLGGCLILTAAIVATLRG